MVLIITSNYAAYLSCMNTTDMREHSIELRRARVIFLINRIDKGCVLCG